MGRVVILAQSKASSAALGAWLTARNLADDRAVPSIVLDDLVGRGLAREELYKAIARLVSVASVDALSTGGRESVTVLVDHVRPNRLNAVSESWDWDALLAMLILAFPEVSWRFGAFRAPSPAEQDTTPETQPTWVENHRLSTLGARVERNPLLDPTGIRDFVRQTTNAGLAHIHAGFALPLRPGLAAAVDEEPAFAHLHAYAAYRFGSRADIILTWAAMEARFSAPGGHDYWLLLEDLSLNFPDKPYSLELMDPVARARHCPQLDSSNAQVEPSDYRVFITVGNTVRAGLELPIALDTLPHARVKDLYGKAKGFWKLVLKPGRGIFGLWEDLGLAITPPSPPPAAAPPAESKKLRHGAPGKLLLIAETLINRASWLKQADSSIEADVLGAVWASDAYEFLARRTPSTAIEALALKHQFELKLECGFSGAEYNIHMPSRMSEIATETRRIAECFEDDRRGVARKNAEMHIIGPLARILRDSSKYDEEQIVINRIRNLQIDSWLAQAWWRKIILGVPLKYIELLMSSLAIFAFWVFMWIFGLFALYTLLHHSGPWFGLIDFLKHPDRHLWSGAIDALSSFFSAGPPASWPNSASEFAPTIAHPRVFMFLTCLSIVSGAIHVGIFISYLYSATTRK